MFGNNASPPTKRTLNQPKRMAKRKEKPPEDTPSPPLDNSLPLVVISIDNAFVQLHTLDLGSKLDDNSKTSKYQQLYQCMKTASFLSRKRLLF